MKTKHKPVESHIFSGMETAVKAQAESAAEVNAEDLTAKLIEPRKTIDAAAAEMEMNSPLFYGSIHPTLF